MILIGQYDSPFVRRVAIALTLYGFSFEHRPWSTFADGELIQQFNPLKRVPTLILDDGRVLLESAYILDWADENRGAVRGLISSSGKDRQTELYYIALAMGFSDKVIALFYENVLHELRSEVWVARCQSQIFGVLDVLEGLRQGAGSKWFMGDLMGHADIALGCALRHAVEAHGAAIPWERWPALLSHSSQCEDTPIFAGIYQPFRGPGASH